LRRAAAGCVVTGLALVAVWPAVGGVQFYFDAVGWHIATGVVEDFCFTDENPHWPVGYLPLTHGKDLGNPLEFPAAETGLSVDFTLSSPASYHYFFSDKPSYVVDCLELGSSGEEDDDWSLMFAGAAVHALAVTVLDNNESLEAETFTVYGAGWQQSITADEVGAALWPHGGPTDQPFIGVVSTEPIAWVLFDEGAVGDNIALGAVFVSGTSIHAGDANCDGHVDFGDINPFVLLLTNPTAWKAAHPGCPLLNGDTNGDGLVDFGDINPFVKLLVGP